MGATSVTSSSLNYRRGYEPLLPAVYQTVYPAAYRFYDGDEEKATANCLKHLDGMLATTVAPSTWPRSSSSRSRARAATIRRPARSSAGCASAATGTGSC